jgi:hypothetical protein
MRLFFTLPLIPSPQGRGNFKIPRPPCGGEVHFTPISFFLIHPSSLPHNFVVYLSISYQGGDLWT